MYFNFYEYASSIFRKVLKVKKYILLKKTNFQMLNLTTFQLVSYKAPGAYIELGILQLNLDQICQDILKITVTLSKNTHFFKTCAIQIFLLSSFVSHRENFRVTAEQRYFFQTRVVLEIYSPYRRLSIILLHTSFTVFCEKSKI